MIIRAAITAALAAAGTAAAVDPTGLTDFFLSQGILGATSLALAYFVLMLRKELRDERAAHKVELASHLKTIYELQDERLKEAREGYAIARSVQTTLDAFSMAMKGQ
jgi:phosphate/sulfate permease